MLNELRRPYNAVTDFVDANVARGLGNKIAFIDPERSLTYGGLQARSIRFANALRELGVEHEQRVALLLNDTVDYPVAFWGTIRAGADRNSTQHLPPSPAIRLHPQRLPRDGAGGRCRARGHDAAGARNAAAASRSSSLVGAPAKLHRHGRACPAIHVFLASNAYARDERGHDGKIFLASSTLDRPEQVRA